MIHIQEVQPTTLCQVWDSSAIVPSPVSPWRHIFTHFLSGLFDSLQQHLNQNFNLHRRVLCCILQQCKSISRALKIAFPLPHGFDPPHTSCSQLFLVLSGRLTVTQADILYLNFTEGTWTNELLFVDSQGILFSLWASSTPGMPHFSWTPGNLFKKHTAPLQSKYGNVVGPKK